MKTGYVTDILLRTPGYNKSKLSVLLRRLGKIAAKHPNASLALWGNDFVVTVDRPETDKERTVRLKREDKYKRRHEAGQRKLFENLKRKYGQ